MGARVMRNTQIHATLPSDMVRNTPLALGPLSSLKVTGDYRARAIA